MNSLTRQYLFGAIFMAVGFYQAFQHHYLECTLYITAGLAFAVNALSLQPQLEKYKKMLGMVSWMLIIVAGVLFFYVVANKF